MSSALRNNTVSRIFSSSSTQKKTQIDFFTQTLTQLDLGWNQIGDKGAEHLSSALRNNTVSRIFSSSSTQKKTQIDFFTQTLTGIKSLHFETIEIGEKGAEHLSSALRNNTVSRIFSSSSTQKKTQIDFFTQTLTVLNLSEQSNRRQRSRTFVFCTSKQHSESNFLFFFNTKKDTNRLFHTDTHCIKSLHFETIKSETKEQNICLLHFETTQ